MVIRVGDLVFVKPFCTAEKPKKSKSGEMFWRAN